MTVKINADTSDGLKFVSDTSGEIDLQTNGTTKVHMDSSGNVGIGTSSPSSTLDVNGNLKAGNTIDFGLADTNNTIMNVGTGATGDKFALTDYIGDTTYTDYGLRVGRKNDGANGTSTIEHRGTGGLQLNSIDAGFIMLATSNSERMRIDSSGKVSIGVTSPYTDGGTTSILNVPVGGSSFGAWTSKAGTTSSRLHLRFANPNGIVGSISTSGTGTAFTVSSDYRLKENVEYTWDATTRLKQLKPARFNFIADADTTVDGFIAHEVSDIVPEAITGEKDAMMTEEYEVTPAVLDDDGNIVEEAVMGTREVPDYQGIDQSKLVPLLVKTIQELEARITALES